MARIPSYDETAASYDALHGEEQLRKRDIVKANLRLRAGARVLDVGCGTGIASQGWDVVMVGIDPSEELLRIARTRMEVVRGVGEALPFPDDSFDAVISLTAIHNMSDPTEAIDEMLRVSRGPIAITVLKKSRSAAAIEKAIRARAKGLRVIDEGTDLIYIGSKA